MEKLRAPLCSKLAPMIIEHVSSIRLESFPLALAKDASARALEKFPASWTPQGAKALHLLLDARRRPASNEAVTSMQEPPLRILCRRRRFTARGVPGVLRPFVDTSLGDDR